MAIYQPDSTLAGQGTAQTPQQLATANTTGSGAGSLDPTINSGNLSGSSQINYSTPASTQPIPPIDTTTTATTLGPNEQNASDLTKQIQDLNNSLSGESTYQTQQNQSAGVNSIQTAINDNTTAIRQLQNQASAIPQQEQQNATGRGITAAGLAPIQTADLRNNSIQALTLSSISDSLNNNLVAAQTKANQAVQAIYGPQEAELKSKMANLQLILNDPATTLEEKNRANAQQAVITAQANKVVQDKADQATILKTAQDAAANAASFKASSNYPTLSATLNLISQAKTPAEAFQIASNAGLTTSKSDQLDNQYKQAQIDKINSDISVANATESTVSSDTLNGMLAVYKSTGVLPAFGNSAKSPLRAQFYAALGSDGGDQIISDAGTNKVVRAGLTTAYKTQQNQYSANQTAISTLGQQLALAQQYSDKVNRSGSPLINKYLLDAKSGVFGDPDTAALHNIVMTASAELAKILSGSAASISGATVSSMADAQTLLNSAMAKGQFNEVLGLMKKEADFRLNSQKDTLNQLQSDLNNVSSLSDSLTKTNTSTPTVFDNLLKQYGG